MEGIMQIEKAYLFARQISAGGAPPMGPEIYFENGVFNPACVPAGFDFHNNVEVYEEHDYYYENSLIFQGGYKALADAGKIARIQYKCSQGHTESWTLEDGVLRFTHTEKELVPPYDWGKDGEILLLPVVGWRPAYPYVNVQYRLYGNSANYGAGVYSWAYDNRLYYPDYGYDNCSDAIWAYDETELSEGSMQSVDQNGHELDSIDMITLDSKPDCYDPSYTFEVIKIWGSSTPVN